MPLPEFYPLRDCPFCEKKQETEVIKGHYKCRVCGKIVEGCCRGSTDLLPKHVLDKREAYEKAEGLVRTFPSWDHVNRLIPDAAQQAKKKKDDEENKKT